MNVIKHLGKISTEVYKIIPKRELMEKFKRLPYDDFVKFYNKILEQAMKNMKNVKGGSKSRKKTLKHRRKYKKHIRNKKTNKKHNRKRIKQH